MCVWESILTFYLAIDSQHVKVRRDVAQKTKKQKESGHIEGIYHECLTPELDILVKKKFWVSNIQARAPTEAVIPKYVQPKTILSLDVPSDLKLILETCWTTFVFMSMLKSRCL